MKVGERGQVTIPKEVRDRFGIGPGTEVDFSEEQGQIRLVIRGSAKKKAAGTVARARRFRQRWK